jgi:hypothetical protein
VSPRPGAVKAASRGRKASKAKVGLNPAAIRAASARDYAVRFVFGAAVSVVAGLVSLRFGPEVGGIFLAFPAILPAALSLIEDKNGEGPADADAQGGIIGAIGIVAFALVVFLAVRHVAAPITLALALAAWALVSSGIYFTLRRAWPKVWG